MASLCVAWKPNYRDYPRRWANGNLWGAAALVLLVALNGCVTTAECDDVVECPSGEACYDFECKVRCDVEGASCGAAQTCEPCEQDDPSGQIDHCPDRDRGAFVCIGEES